MQSRGFYGDSGCGREIDIRTEAKTAYGMERARNVAGMNEENDIWLAEVAHDWMAALWLVARRHDIDVLLN